jgi:hypothetical protein
MDPFLKLSLITGVSKFTKTSVFSELNNLLDITLFDKYANICGIPVESVSGCFGEHIGDLARRKGAEFGGAGEILEKILAWYDGFSWDGASRVVNPFSLLTLLVREKISSYWYSSGTPSFLVGIIKDRPESYLELEGLQITESSLETYDLARMELAPLLFQSGYLTVESVADTGASPAYRLAAPNLEVREALGRHITAELTGSGSVRTDQAYGIVRASLQSGDLAGMLGALRGLFSSIPYELHLGSEAYYHSIFLAFMRGMGFGAEAEVSVSRGRVDAVLELCGNVYVMEFKHRACPRNASQEDKQKIFGAALAEGMAQIKARGYHSKYLGGAKRVFLAVFAFLGRDEIEMVSIRL